MIENKISKLMPSNIRRSSTIKIYVIQYTMFIVASLFFIIGIIRIKSTEVMDVITWLWLISGTFLFLMAYIYAKKGALVIQRSCPYCFGTGFITVGKGKTKYKQICPICNGTGLFLSKTEIEVEKEKKRLQKEQQNKRMGDLRDNPVTKEEKQNDCPSDEE